MCPFIETNQKLFFINVGVIPPYHSSTCKEGTLMFNYTRLVLEEDPTGYLHIGDLVETRDLQFKGIFAGCYNGTYFFNLEFIKGALPLQSFNPEHISYLFRLLDRQSYKVPMLIDDRLEQIQMREKEIYLCCTPRGLAFPCGTLNNGQYVLRLLTDLFNNSTPIVVDALPPNLLSILGIDCTRSKNLVCLDSYENEDGGILMFLGTSKGVTMFWDGEQILLNQRNDVLAFSLSNFVYDKKKKKVETFAKCVPYRAGELKRPLNPTFQTCNGSPSLMYRGCFAMPNTAEGFYNSLNEKFLPYYLEFFPSDSSVGRNLPFVYTTYHAQQKIIKPKYSSTTYEIGSMQNT